MEDLVIQAWKDDTFKLISTRRRADDVLEITLPYSTLTDKFVRLFIDEPTIGNYLISDGGDLHSDEYETTAELEVSGPFLQGKELLAKQAWAGIKQEGEAFVCKTDLRQLTAKMFDMAEFIQLSVNLAYLST
jgi:hypothetical protein